MIRVLVLLLFSVVPVQAVTVRQMLGDNRYWPPACAGSTCVLTGLGGIVQVWVRWADTEQHRGKHFVVRGVCASACAIAARRVHARLLPGARLIEHKPSSVVWD